MRTKGTKNKGRKGLSLLLVMCMVLTLLPVTAAAAEGNCTGDHAGWTKLSGNVSSLAGGKYVLTGDVQVQADIFINSEVTLCLSGHTMNLNGHNIIINGNAGTEASLALHDCAGSGSITGGNGGTASSDRYGGAVYVGASATFSMYGGAITQNTANDGGGVYVASGTFNMYGGSITKNKTDEVNGSDGGGVYVSIGGSFNMHEGLIAENQAYSNGGGICTDGSGTFSMYGGTITQNTAYYGGGVYVGGSTNKEITSSMSGSAKITGNTADYGGGMYVTQGTGSFTMSGSAQITGNTADYGGGVYVNYTGFSMSESAKIAQNDATSNGGGVYLAGSSSKGSFTMSGSAQIAENAAGNGSGGYVQGGSFSMSGSAQIIQNDATSNGGGVCVTGSSGSFSMSGSAKITGNTAGYGGGGHVSSRSSFSMSESAQIAKNTATAGGGAYVTSNGSFSMSGSTEIVRNTADPHGGGLFMDGTAFTVSGNVKVTGNGKSTADGTGNNVRLVGGGKTVTIGADGLQDGAEIGVNMSQAGVFTSGGGEAYEGYFYSDSFHHVIVKESGELKLEEVSAHPHSHTLSGEGAEEAFLPLSTFTQQLNEGSYYLARDIAMEGDEGQITISGTVNLCLNGHTFDGSAGYGVFRVGAGATLNICDCSQDESGLLRGDAAGAAILVHSGGACNLYSGTISSNGSTALAVSTNQLGPGSYEGGQENTQGGSVRLYGGRVEAAGGSSQGIEVSSGLENAGVGVYGGAAVSGVRYAVNLASGTVTLSGSPDITGGTADLYLQGGSARIAVDGSLEGTFRVGMDSPGVFTTGGAAGHIGSFASADSDYSVAANGDNELMLASGYTVTFQLNGGQGSSPADQFVTSGGKVQKPADPARDGHTFAGWYNGPALWDFESGTVTGPLELTAMWIQNPETTAVSGDLSQPYKTQGAQISVTVAQQSGHSYSYQWYRGTAADGSDKAPLSGATERTYELPEDLPLGTLYYFCEITAGISGSPERSAVTSGPIAVEIRARDYEADGGITVTPIGEQPFRGSPLQPKPEISCGFDLLQEGIDYDLAYGENTAVGTGTVTVTFKGSYTGKTRLDFPIAYASLPGGKSLEDYVEIPAPNGAGWYRQKIVLTPKEGVSIGTGDDAAGGVAIANEGEGLAQELFIKDKEGNIFRAGFSYSLDTTAPTAGELSPATGDWTADAVTVSLSASDGTSGIAGVTLEKPDGSGQALTGDGSYSFEAGVNGVYTVTVTDRAGNSTKRSITIGNIDSSTPGLDVSGGELSGRSLSLTVTAQQNGDSEVTVTVSRNGADPQEIPGGEYAVSESGTYTFTAKTQAGTQATVQKTVYDVRVGESAEVVVSGGRVAQRGNPDRPGYTFVEWYNEATGRAWDFGDTVTQSLVLVSRWTLDGPEVELTADSTQATYNGGETVITLAAKVTHKAQGLSYSYEWYQNGRLLSATGDRLPLSRVADGGSYTVKVTAGDTELTSTAVESSPVVVTIDKANPVTRWPKASELTYGDALGSSELTGGEAVEGSFAWEDGVRDETPAVADSGRQYPVVFTPRDTDNYSTVTQGVAVTVNRALLTPFVASVRDKTYDGSTETGGAVELEGAVLGQVPKASGEFKFETKDAGTGKKVFVTVTLDGDWGQNYELSTDRLEAEADIAPKEVQVVWSGFEDLVYSGNPVAVTASVRAGDLEGEDVCAVLVEGADEIHADDYTARATGLTNGNYRLPDPAPTQDYTIDPLPVQLSWDYEDPFSYDRQTKTVTAKIDNLAAGDQYELSYENNEKTGAGEYTAAVTGLGNSDYTLEGGTGRSLEWRIEQAVVSFVVSANRHTYDKEPKRAQVAQPAGQVVMEDGSYTVDCDGEDSQTVVGTYPVTVTLHDDNFCFEDGEASAVVGELVILEAQVVIPQADGREFVYDGTQQTYHIEESPYYTVEGNLQKEAGDHTVRVALKDTENYTWEDGSREEKTYPFAIGKKTITGTWQGLTQVYDGTAKTVTVSLKGLVQGDEGLSATVTAKEGDMTSAGSHLLTATMENYIVVPAEATLEIQKKPVFLTLEDNVAQAGEPFGGVTVAASDADFGAGDYRIVYRDSKGAEVENPTQPGSYEVWLEITNSNYRLPDGSTKGQIGSYLVADTAPTLYSVSFDGGEGATGGMEELEAAGGSLLILPECGFEKEGFAFAGWEHSGKLWQPGAAFEMPRKNITLTARWSETQSVTGTVKDEAGAPVDGAVVSLWKGSDKLCEFTTGDDGVYRFPDLAPGDYNLSAAVGDRIVTTAVTVEQGGGVTGGGVILPDNRIDTRVEVSAGSAGIVVDGLGGVLSQEDEQAVEEGGSAEVTVKVQQKKESSLTLEQAELLEDSAGRADLGMYVDISMDKSVTTAQGQTEDAKGAASEELLTVIIPLPAELSGRRNYTVVRTDGSVGAALSDEADPQTGEYYEVSEDATTLILHVKESALYAVGYRRPSSSGPLEPSEPSGSSGTSGTVQAPQVQESENGSFTFGPEQPAPGEVVTVTPTPDEGYEVAQVTVVEADGSPVTVTPGEDGTYSFVQPGSGVTISVVFRQDSDFSGCLRDGSCPLSDFTDLEMSAWYHDGIHFCLAEGLMQGVSDALFEPDSRLARGMLVQMLYNREGRPAVSGGTPFGDVEDGAWYADAVNWAVQTGVAQGYDNGNFGPDDPITREQLAALLYRYALAKGYDADAGSQTALAAYGDAGEVSGYALPAMRWACDAGIVTGVTESALEPRGTATRAQAATMLMRFLNLVSGGEEA